jgi:GAF domain-containing protein
VSFSPRVAGPRADEPLGQELQALFHRLNNQLGIVLAHAELLEAKASDAANRERAAQVVSDALAALGTVREICQRTGPSGEQLA